MVSLGYDAAGNRTSLTRVNGTASLLPTAVDSATYDAANEQAQFGSATLTYDANGNLTNDGINTYTWDARNRLVSISGGVTASFQYDALGRRLSKTITGITTNFLYDGIDIAAEIQGAAVIATYLRSIDIDEPFIRQIMTGEFYHNDALGSTVVLSNANGAPATSYSYEPFGNTTIAGNASSNSYQYTGRENDGTGLYYYRARYYSPRLQRFAAEDPIGLRGGFNYYAYALNNPIRYVDPTGTLIAQIIGGAIGAGSGAYAAYSNDPNASWSMIVQSAAVGGAAGVLSTLPIPGVNPLFSGIIMGMAGGFFGNVGTQILSCPQGNIDWGSTGLATLAGGIGGLAGGAVAGAVSRQGMQIFTPLGQDVISSSVAGIVAGGVDAYAQGQYQQSQLAGRKSPEGCHL